MRITVNLPDDIHQIARTLAESRGISLGAALAELVRRGLESSEKPFPCFKLPPGADPITLEQTLAAEDGL